MPTNDADHSKDQEPQSLAHTHILFVVYSGVDSAQATATGDSKRRFGKVYFLFIVFYGSDGGVHAAHDRPL